MQKFGKAISEHEYSQLKEMFNSLRSSQVQKQSGRSWDVITRVKKTGSYQEYRDLTTARWVKYHSTPQQVVENAPQEDELILALTELEQSIKEGVGKIAEALVKERTSAIVQEAEETKRTAEQLITSHNKEMGELKEFQQTASRELADLREFKKQANNGGFVNEIGRRLRGAN